MRNLLSSCTDQPCGTEETDNYFDFHPARQRLELIREMYQNGAEVSPTSPEPSVNSMTCNDPFYDRFPWFRLIGRAFVYLSNIFYGVTLIHRVAIVSEKGDVRGFLRIAVQLIENESDNSAISACGVTPTMLRHTGTANIEFNDVEYFGKKWSLHNSSSSISGAITSSDEERFVEGHRSESISEGASKKEIPCDDINGSCRGTILHLGALQDNSAFINMVDKMVDFSEMELPKHLQLNSRLTFRIAILQATAISSDYADVFCQFNFIHRQEEAFSTEPLKNSGKPTALGFYYVQNFTVDVTRAFIDYIRHQPIVFEVYGHQQQQQNECEKSSSSADAVINLSRSNSRRTFPPTLPLSAPVPPTKLSPTTAVAPLANEGVILQRYDLLIWVELLELASNGEYAPVQVEHFDDLPCQGVFMLHHGLQRRLALTIVHEPGPELLFRDVREVVVGRVRDTPEYLDCDEFSKVLSLSLLPAHYIAQNDDERIFFRFEAAWDSSLHESPLLNMVTPTGERIYLTLSCYLDVDNCSMPICITKDICLIVYPRDTKLTMPRSLKNLFGNFYKFQDFNRVSGVYDFQIKKVPEKGMAMSHRRLIKDTSSTYVRGEENLNGWRPRSDSLISEHQWELEKLTRLELVERARHVLLLREKLCELGRVEALSCLDIEAQRHCQELSIPSNCSADDTHLVTSRNLLDDASRSCCKEEQEKMMTTRCVKLMSTGLSGGLANVRGPIEPLSSSDDNAESESSSIESSTKIKIETIDSPNAAIFSGSVLPSASKLRPSSSGMSDLFMPAIRPELQLNLALRKSPTIESFKSSTSEESVWNRSGNGLFTPGTGCPPLPMWNGILALCDEVRVSPVVSRRGYLKFLDEKTANWVRRWVVVRRPFLYVYHHERDPVERGLINLATASIEYNEEQCSLVKTRNIFAVITIHRGFLIQTLEDSEVYDWLYAFNPLMAGQMRSKLGRKKCDP